LAQREGHHLKADLLDLKAVLTDALALRSGVDIRGGTVVQQFRLETRLENAVVDACRGVIEGTEKFVRLAYPITNSQRTFGATLSYHIAKAYQAGETVL